MATQSKSRARVSWRDLILSLVTVVIPVILEAALNPDPEKDPVDLVVRSKEGVGNIEITAISPGESTPRKR